MASAEYTHFYNVYAVLLWTLHTLRQLFNAVNYALLSICIVIFYQDHVYQNLRLLSATLCR